MRIIKKDPDVHIHKYQLSDEDYKNIFTRVFWKFWWMSLVLLGFLIGGGYFLIKQISENTVQQILSKEIVKSNFYDYKERLFLKASQDITEAKEYYINELKKYEYLPYSLSNNSLKVFDKNGKALIVEFGRGKTSDTIRFKEHFDNLPNVQVSFADPKERSRINDFKNSDIYNEVTFRMSLNIKEITRKYFIAFYGLPNTIKRYKYQVEFNWMAIGY
jgi:hypothetical protein